MSLFQPNSQLTDYILNIIEFVSYQYLHFVWVATFYDPYSSSLSYQFLHYLVTLIFKIPILLFKKCYNMQSNRDWNW